MADLCQCPYICDELLREILSRLPIKALLVCQSVCKNFRKIVHELQEEIIMTDPQSLPVFGFLTADHIYFAKYVGIETGEIVNLPRNTSNGETNLVISSGYDKGLLAGFSLDLSALTDNVFRKTNSGQFREFFYTMHQGLLLLSYFNGTYEVRNPVTKQSYVVTTKKGQYDGLLTIGMVVTFPTLPGSKCEFMIVRLSERLNSLEIYCSEMCSWERSELEVLGENNLLRNDTVNQLTWENYVALVDGLDVITLYLLTENNVVAIKFRGKNPPKITDQYVIPLPQGVKGNRVQVNIWDCGGTLFLTDFTRFNKLRMWKHPKDYCSTQADACAWTPLVRIATRITMQIKASYGGCRPGLPIRLIGCNPDVGVMYFFIRPFVLAYDVTNDTLHKIAADDMYIPMSAVTVRGCFPLKPCFSSLDALK